MRAGLVILCFILLKLCAEAQPVKDIDINTSCINMTPERAEEIKNISKEVTMFINALADKYDDIDFLVFKMKIENHSDDEKEEKETLLKILVNDCKANPLSHDDYFNGDDDNNDSEQKHKSTTNDTSDKDEPHSIKSSDNESSARENKEENIEHNRRLSDKLTKEAKINTQSENANTKPNKADLQNKKNDKEVKVDDTSEENGKDSKIIINYNFNGSYDNANLYISPPKESQDKIGKGYEQLYKELYQSVFGKIKRNISPNRSLQQIYEQPRGLGYHDNPNEIDDLWNIMMEKLRGEANPKNCVYALKKICGDFGENLTN